MNEDTKNKMYDLIRGNTLSLTIPSTISENTSILGNQTHFEDNLNLTVERKKEHDNN